MASPKVPDCSDVPRRYQKSSTPMAISTCSPPSVKSAADSGQQAEAFALVDHLHCCVASAPRVGSHLRPPLTRTATAPRQPSPPGNRLPCPTSNHRQETQSILDGDQACGLIAFLPRECLKTKDQGARLSRNKSEAKKIFPRRHRRAAGGSLHAAALVRRV